MARKRFSGFQGRRQMGGVRWGHLWELDRSAMVGSAEWKAAHPELRLRLLSAWRYLHTLRKHPSIRRWARKMGVSPSSNIGLQRMLALAERFQRGTNTKMESQRVPTGRSKATGRKSGRK